VRVPPQAPAIVSSATAAGKVTAGIYAEGLPTTYRVEFGPTRAYGAQTRTASVPATAREQPISVPLPGLLAGSTYHARVVATSSVGSSTGPDVVVKVPAGPPRIAYAPPAAANGVVTLRARVTAGGLPTAVSFQYGTTRGYGKRTPSRRVTGTTTVSVQVRFTPGTLVHFRAVATNAKGKQVAGDRTVRS
jgi:hypothetical protein